MNRSWIAFVVTTALFVVFKQTSAVSAVNICLWCDEELLSSMATKTCQSVAV